MSDPLWNHNTHYHPLALQLARTGGRALDVGCGEGLLTRRLVAAGIVHATGIDLDAEQVERACDRAAGDQRLDYVLGDVHDLRLDERGYDLVTCVATLHHLDLDTGLTRLRGLTAPGGHLVVIGLARSASVVDHVVSLAGVPVSLTARASRGTWDHGAPMTDPTTTYRDVRRSARRLLPGVRWRRHVYWRYSLVWHAPGTSS